MPIVLKPKYSVSADAKTLTVKELTGQYSPINTGGYSPSGTPNPKANEATVAQIRIARRNSDGTFGTETTVNVYSTLPSDIGGSIDILSTLAGQGGNFADAIYRFTYMVQGVWVSNASIPFLTQDVRYVPLIPSICACWQKKAAAFSEKDCNCNDDEAFRMVSIYMRLLEGAYECQDLNALQKFIDKLIKLCADCGCAN